MCLSGEGDEEIVVASAPALFFGGAVLSAGRGLVAGMLVAPPFAVAAAVFSVAGDRIFGQVLP